MRADADRPRRDHGHLELLAARYRYLRTFTPAVLAALPLTGNTASADVAALLAAVDVLRELNRTGREMFPDPATTASATSFVPARWRGYLDATRGQAHGGAYRHYWELGVLYGVQTALRAGDVWVPGSRRYTDPATLLIGAEQWATQRDDFCSVTGTSLDPHEQLRRLETDLHSAVADMEQVLAGAQGLARLGDSGDLIVSPLPAEQLPADADALQQATAARLPHVQLPALLIEVDAWTRFTEELTHAGGAQRRHSDLTRNLFAALLTSVIWSREPDLALDLPDCVVNDVADVAVAWFGSSKFVLGVSRCGRPAARRSPRASASARGAACCRLQFTDALWRPRGGVAGRRRRRAGGLGRRGR